MVVNLHSIEEAAAATGDHAITPFAHALDEIDATYFVIQRGNGHWTAASKIMSVHASEDEAEAAAERLAAYHTSQRFGVAMLLSELRPTSKPVEIVRVSR